MKAWEIIGWAFNAALYHDGCEPEGCHNEEQPPHVDKASPVFASTELDPHDACDHCLHTWIASTEPTERSDGAPAYVYMSGEKPASNDLDD